MKFTISYVAIILIALVFMLSGCGKDDADKITDFPEITDQNCDWEVSLYVGDFGKASTDIEIWWLGDSYPEGTIELKIDDEVVSLENDFYSYWGYVDLAPGQNFDLEFYVDGQKKMDRSFRTPAMVNGNFPSTFTNTQATTFTWNLNPNVNSSYQMVFASSYPEDSMDDDGTFFSKMLSPSARSYTLPANTLANWGSDTFYFLSIQEADARIENRVGVVVGSMDFAGYLPTSKDKDERSIRRSMHRAILNNIK